MGIALIFPLYAIVTVLSIFGGYLPKLFVDKKGMNPYAGRMLAMLIFAFLPLLLCLQSAVYGVRLVACYVIIGLAGAGHQAWSANLFSTIGDMFPKSPYCNHYGIGGMAGGVGSYLINKGAGALFTPRSRWARRSVLRVQGKPAGYMIIFCICAVAYLVAWMIMKTIGAASISPSF